MKIITLFLKRAPFTYMFIFLFAFMSNQTYATHIKSAEITYKRISNSSFTYRFTVKAIRDASAEVTIGLGVFDLGDGNTIDNPREKFDSGALNENGELIVSSFDITRLGNYELNRFEIVYTYSSPVTQLTVSYREENRTEGILNVGNSVNTAFYVESEIKTDPVFGINNSPELFILPLDEGVTGEIFIHNPGAFDADGDSLSYSLITPKQAKGLNVNFYISPNAPQFYNDFNSGNSNQDGPPTFEIDARTGTVTWDSPGKTGEYTIAILIEEWRRVDGVRFKVGSIIRDMQITIEDSGIIRPVLKLPVDQCLTPGNILEESIKASTESGHEVTLDIFSNTTNIDTPPVVDTPVFSNGQTSVRFFWETNRQQVRNTPWQFIARATSQDGVDNLISTFQNWKIAIKDEAPTGLEADTSLTATIDLIWDTYPLEGSDKIQIWRRENSISAFADSCFSLPVSYGYELIKSIDASETFFRDDNNGNGLLAGTNYCYRITATHSSAPDIFSFFSRESCDKLGGIRPVITSAIPELTETTFYVYPNPSHDLVTIHSTINIRYLELIDIKGNVVYESRPGHLKTTMNLPGIENGIYLIRAYTDQGIVTKRLVKK